jgi:hypothetical protein
MRAAAFLSWVIAAGSLAWAQRVPFYVENFPGSEPQQLVCAHRIPDRGCQLGVVLNDSGDADHE